MITAINESYPEPEWVRAYSDGSKVGMGSHPGAGVCQEFAHMPVDAEGTVFEGEVKAIEVALLSLFPRIHNFNRVVVLVDSKAAIQAVASDITPKVPSITEYRQMLQTLSYKHIIF